MCAKLTYCNNKTFNLQVIEKCISVIPSDIAKIYRSCDGLFLKVKSDSMWLKFKHWWAYLNQNPPVLLLVQNQLPSPKAWKASYSVVTSIVLIVLYKSSMCTEFKNKIHSCRYTGCDKIWSWRTTVVISDLTMPIVEVAFRSSVL